MVLDAANGCKKRYEQSQGSIPPKRQIAEASTKMTKMPDNDIKPKIEPNIISMGKK